jgi:hypothetical protein
MTAPSFVGKQSKIQGNLNVSEFFDGQMTGLSHPVKQEKLVRCGYTLQVPSHEENTSLPIDDETKFIVSFKYSSKVLSEQRRLSCLFRYLLFHSLR